MSTKIEDELKNRILKIVDDFKYTRPGSNIFIKMEDFEVNVDKLIFRAFVTQQGLMRKIFSIDCESGFRKIVYEKTFEVIFLRWIDKLLMVDKNNFDVCVSEEDCDQINYVSVRIK